MTILGLSAVGVLVLTNNYSTLIQSLLRNFSYICSDSQLRAFLSNLISQDKRTDTRRNEKDISLNTLFDHEHNDEVMTRLVMKGRLCFNFYRPGVDLRQQGDGAESENCSEDYLNLGNTSGEDDDDYDDHMKAFIREAEEIRRLIRCITTFFRD